MKQNRAPRNKSTYLQLTDFQQRNRTYTEKRTFSSINVEKGS